MRYLYAVIAIGFIFSTSAMAAEMAQKGVAVAKQDAAVERQDKEIVTDLNDKRSDDKEYGVDNEREMPQHETYDENTGLPNVVPSDKEGEM